MAGLLVRSNQTRVILCISSFHILFTHPHCLILETGDSDALLCQLLLYCLNFISLKQGWYRTSREFPAIWLSWEFFFWERIVKSEEIRDCLSYGQMACLHRVLYLPFYHCRTNCLLQINVCNRSEAVVWSGSWPQDKIKVNNWSLEG